MSRKPKSPAACMTDMRIGVTPVEHELLDLITANRAALSPLGPGHLIDTGAKDAAAALRADPARGLAARRREKALAAAARLLLAVEQMGVSA
jgi:hypothetical protein